MKNKISVVFPVYKKNNVEEKIRKYWEMLNREHQTEIIVVIEGIDRKEYLGLEKELKFAKIIWNEKRMGKGWAVRNGLAASKGEVIGFVDSDEAISPKEVSRLVRLVGKEGIVIGSRKPWHYRSKIRRILSSLFNFYIKILLGLKVNDSQCGVKFFRKEKILGIINRMKINGFAFDTEILYLLKKKGEKITEEKIEWKDVGKSTVGLLSIIGMAVDILRIRFNF